MNSIREIDREHNGHVTKTELDDILKMHLPKEFGDKDLHPIINRFSSISNKILINYKQFQFWLRDRLFALDGLESKSTTRSILKNNTYIINKISNTDTSFAK